MIIQFQMDGNMGFVAAICELFVQSHISGVLSLLPALPPQIAVAGRVSGVGARGGVTVSIIWGNSAVSAALLTFEASHPWYAPRPSGGSGLVEESPGYFRWPNGWENSLESLVAILSPNALRIMTSKQHDAILPGGKKGKKSKKIIKKNSDTLQTSCAEWVSKMTPAIDADPTRSKVGMWVRVSVFPCTVTLCNAESSDADCVEKVRLL